mgnify:CR=1 FL=1
MADGNKGYQRRENMDLNDSGDRSNKKEDVNIAKEISLLRKKKNVDPRDIFELSTKYGDQKVVDEILKQYTKQSAKARKEIKKLAIKVYDNMTKKDRPYHEVLEKMAKIKVKHGWSDAEFDMFKNELRNLLDGKTATEIDLNQNIMTNRSRINRALGGYQYFGIDMNIKEKDVPVLHEIISMHDKSRNAYNTNMLQCMTYRDCAIAALSGSYDRNKHIATNHINPLIACMFLPKINIFDIHMLISDFGRIIKTRFNQKDITHEADLILYNDIIVDPMDVVCDTDSPMTDIKNRYRVQLALRDTVSHLRNGQYYEARSTAEFITTLSACRNNVYDNADLAFNNDEGAILKRLMSVFSMRPTIVSTRPIPAPGLMMGFPAMSGFGLPFNNAPIYTVTMIPMIALNIPPRLSKSDRTDTSSLAPMQLTSALNQTLWLNDNRVMAPKEQNVIYSKQVLIFYVNRRIQNINIRTVTATVPFSHMPMAASGFEKLNDYPVIAPERLSLKTSDETFYLRSVVAVTETRVEFIKDEMNIITGSTGLIMKHRDIDNAEYNNHFYLYDPVGASLPQSVDGGYYANRPITEIEGYVSDTVEPFFDRVKRTGTIFIYVKPGGYDDTKSILL